MQQSDVSFHIINTHSDNDNSEKIGKQVRRCNLNLGNKEYTNKEKTEVENVERKICPAFNGNYNYAYIGYISIDSQAFPLYLNKLYRSCIDKQPVMCSSLLVSLGTRNLH